MFGISKQKCTWCGKSLVGDGDRFECHPCDAVFYLVDGELVDSLLLDPALTRESSTCISCQSSLRGGTQTSEWENGDNSSSFVTCPKCGTDNFYY
jgi:hypothetical protein